MQNAAVKVDKRPYRVVAKLTKRTAYGVEFNCPQCNALVQDENEELFIAISKGAQVKGTCNKCEARVVVYKSLLVGLK